MKHDIFFSVCQTPVDGWMPDERGMFQRFFAQARLADSLGFGTAWVAETHLSCQVQKRNPDAVITGFEGEIGLNTDTLQLAHRLFAQTRRISVGSAIRNILSNGGPIAHTEAVRGFLSLHGLDDGESRLLELGFGAGRFPFSVAPYGIVPRSALERAQWSTVRTLIFREATEIFLRLLRGDVLASRDLGRSRLTQADFASEPGWHQACLEVGLGTHQAAALVDDAIELDPRWQFEALGVVPIEVPMRLLALTIGTQDVVAQDLANEILPCGVFNLSITPDATIERTNDRLRSTFHKRGGPWSRARMPRTVLVFIDDDPSGGVGGQRRRARERAERALSAFWRAMDGTVAPAKLEQAADNALVGAPEDVIAQIDQRFHRDDRLMLWFDFNNHDSEAVQHAMRVYMEQVVPFVRGRPPILDPREA